MTRTVVSRKKGATKTTRIGGAALGNMTDLRTRPS
jgi:hypothetical protein